LTLPKSVREFLRADNDDLIVLIKDHDKILVKRGAVKIEDKINNADRGQLTFS
jgi:bifunctional DNA-binding transcriptional regulator/antitoxin component of YhaV-PrlF toxin-antitoxin module